MAVGSFLVSSASAVTGYMAQSQQAAQANRIASQTRQHAYQAFADKQAALTQRQSQEQVSAAQQKFEAGLDAKKGAATHLVAMGESGASGISFEHLLNDFSGRLDRYNDRIDQQTDWTVDQLQAQKKGAGYETVDRINSAPRRAEPSFVDLGLRVAGAAINAGTTYRRSSL